MTNSDAPVGQLRSIDLLGALSLASDMAVGLSAGHGVRATYIGMRIADALGLPASQLTDLFYAEVLMDAGCTAWTSRMAAAILGDDIVARRQLFFFTNPSDPRDLLKWLASYMAAGERLNIRLKHVVNFAMHGRSFMVEGLQNTSDVAARLALRLGRSAGVQEALRFVFEQWDGSGPHSQRAAAIPLVSRIVFATIFLEVLHQVEGRRAAVELARSRRGKALDPSIVDAFESLAATDEFWRGLESDTIWATVRQMEPDSPYRYFSLEKLDDAARAFGDFADLKSFYTAGHSRRVAALAEQMAPSCGVGPADLVTLRRAALLHDLGMVAVPSFVLHKPEDRLSAAEWESLRLHPYHAKRILERVPAFAPVIPIVAAHHERPDGHGYFNGLASGQIPLGARIIGVADRFDELTHAGPGRPALEPDAAIAVMQRESGSGLCRDSFAALLQALHRDAPIVRSREPAESKGHWPLGLTDREVEVLRLLATGASRRDIAKRLSVSENTVRHHLEHIYDKADVRTKVGATLFAIERGLFR